MSTQQVPQEAQELLTKIVEILISQNDWNTKNYGDKWHNQNLDFTSVLIEDSANLIRSTGSLISDLTYKLDHELVKTTVVELWTTILSRFMTSSADIELVINKLAPVLMPMVATLDIPGAIYFDKGHIVENTHSLLRRVLINEDLQVLLMSMIHLTLSAGIDFSELHSRILETHS